ncbi:bifunctional [glutamate--ammonia ligase]-adenylyl-L-tyrosine phosphorylase/[glutamate--ammonia-ligase] adenylyltransferase [Neisseria sp. 83E34]|uniref:bifunctional [glutamate--ammonia ligase]-adenylyl-L-tyrosine phosphorylase/[glutamate--ammonia-ligase] adenylyltransferase n=1 Tax=Neisseria sp. 83E34 TaxID=1692264 RepID=UPI0018D0E312|nr:bifunctional [glutamate--ammonia ligase]-adenylyl-L-tyrosine phosphorylase/[glutamate--ammonia-ligase] adenylyltransferase [Neisseria sp. 83E34]
MIMSTIETARCYSQYLSRHLDNGNLKPEILNPLLSRPLDAADFYAFADWEQLQHDENEAELARQLRLLRRYVMAHILIRDINRISDLNEVTGTITRFAEFAVNTALNYAYAYYQDMYGMPIGRYSGTPQHLSVVAMGKAGGYELNVSSDIDLIFIYPENGDTNGKRERTNQEFFTKVGQKLITLLNDITADGQVFRVDMRLRPDGDSGPLVLSETALEQYLITQGREWERYAWCKGRIITPHANDIAALVRPFVFRKYLDFNAYEAMRGLHRQIRREVQKKDMADNIKLGAGGIREIEFIAQIFQMIRGGQIRALQLKGTQETLKKLEELVILSSETIAGLLEAYRFLRDIEHRLQYWDDQQTQTLPREAEQQQLLAQSMGFNNYEAFSDRLQQHRRFVNRTFEQVLAEPEENHDEDTQELAALWHESGDDAERHEQLASLGFDAASVSARLNQLRNSSKYRHLSERALHRFDTVVPQIIAAAQQCSQPTQTLFRLLDFLETVSTRSSYLAFLHEYPKQLQQLAEIMSQSSWVADYLQRHPVLLDGLLSSQLMKQEQDWSKVSAELAQTLEACDDTENKMDTLRHFQHAQTFRLAVQDLAGLWKVEALSDELSLIADIILTQTLIHAWRDMPKTHSDAPGFAIIGYGKLGGKELGYTSDLDLVFLYDDPHPDASDTYTRLARRLTTWLSGSTGAGTLYDVDLRLRPNGDSGFLAHTVDAFEKYQHKNAWTWEHQALTRARYIAGSPEIGNAFERIRREILTQERNADKLRNEIIEMREKMFPTHPPLDSDVKYARGGIVDVEFIVQYLILAQSRHCPALLENYGNIALLRIAAEHGLIDAESARLSRRAYRFFRKLQHDKKLRDVEKIEAGEELSAHYQAVKKLWQEVFGEAPKTA